MAANIARNAPQTTAGAEELVLGETRTIFCNPNRVPSTAQEESTLVIWDNRRLSSLGEISTSLDSKWKETEVSMTVAPRMAKALLFSSEKEAWVMARRRRSMLLKVQLAQKKKKLEQYLNTDCERKGKGFTRVVFGGFRERLKMEKREVYGWLRVPAKGEVTE